MPARAPPPGAHFKIQTFAALRWNKPAISLVEREMSKWVRKQERVAERAGVIGETCSTLETLLYRRLWYTLKQTCQILHKNLLFHKYLEKYYFELDMLVTESSPCSRVRYRTFRTEEFQSLARPSLNCPG